MFRFCAREGMLLFRNCLQTRSPDFASSALPRTTVDVATTLEKRSMPTTDIVTRAHGGAPLSARTLVTMDASAATALGSAHSKESAMVIKILREALLAKVGVICSAFEAAQDVGYEKLEELFQEYDFLPLWGMFTSVHPDWASTFATHCECEDTQAKCVFSALIEQPAFTVSQQDLFAILSSYLGKRMVNRGAARALLIGSTQQVRALRATLGLTPSLDSAVRASLLRSHVCHDFDLDDDADDDWLTGRAAHQEPEQAAGNKRRRAIL